MNKKAVNILIWQWGKKGAGPKIAVELSKALRKNFKLNIFLSLSDRAEIITYIHNFKVDILFKTYSTVGGFILSWLKAPLLILNLYFNLKKNKIKLAICTMPGPLDLMMIAALKLLKIPSVVIIHDAFPHPGDGYLCQHFLQKLLIRKSDLVVTFTKYVYNQLIDNKIVACSKLIEVWHPPLTYCYHTKSLKPNKDIIHLLNFGRLLPYKGFDILYEALDLINTNKSFFLRIVGQGPKSKILTLLNKRKNVKVENRWVQEDEIASIIEWADAIILPYQEASQSGVLAIALAFGKPVLITKVGGLVEQCGHKDLVFLCDPSPQDIARKIEKMLDLPFPLHREKLNSNQEWEKMAGYLIQQIIEKLKLNI